MGLCYEQPHAIQAGPQLLLVLLRCLNTNNLEVHRDWRRKKRDYMSTSTKPHMQGSSVQGSDQRMTDGLGNGYDSQDPASQRAINPGLPFTEFSGSPVISSVILKISQRTTGNDIVKDSNFAITRVLVMFTSLCELITKLKAWHRAEGLE